MKKAEKLKALKSLNSLKKYAKSIPLSTWMIIACVLLFSVLLYSGHFWYYARTTGGIIGESTGKLVGRALGSLDGITRGRAEGREAGKTEGLSANDTTADIATKIKNVNKLEVLVASGTFSDVLKIGEEHKPDYAVLLSMKYNAVFTVDLETAEIQLTDKGLKIVLDSPSVEFYPIEPFEKKNEYIKPGFITQTGSAEDGYTAAGNSLNMMKDKAQKRLQNDKSLIDAAKASAEAQLTQLVSAVSISKPQVFVEFRGGVVNEKEN